MVKQFHGYRFKVLFLQDFSETLVCLYGIEIPKSILLYKISVTCPTQSMKYNPRMSIILQNRKRWKKCLIKNRSFHFQRQEIQELMSSSQEKRIKNQNVEERQFHFSEEALFFKYISVNTFRINFLSFLITCSITTNVVSSDANFMVEF